MSEEEHVVVRLARPGDYQSIMDINDDVYGGLDYLPAMLKSYIHGSHSVYVVEDNGKIVTCEIKLIHPGPSQSMCAMSGRSHPDHQSKGHIFAIEYRAMMDALSKGITTMVGDAFWGNFWKENWGTYQEKYKMEEKRRWRVFMFKADRQAITKMPTVKQQNSEGSTHQLSYIEALRLASTSTAIEDIICKDGDYFACGNNWMTLPTNTECFKLALQENYTFVTFDEKSIGSPLLALSMGSMIPVKCGIRIDLYFYGVDKALFHVHIRAQLSNLLAKCNSNEFGIVFHFPICLECEKIEKELVEYLGARFQFAETEDPTEAFIFLSPINSY